MHSVLKGAVRSVLELVSPATLNKRYINKATPFEPEIEWLPRLVKPQSTVIDIGSNRGLYV